MIQIACMPGVCSLTSILASNLRSGAFGWEQIILSLALWKVEVSARLMRGFSASVGLYTHFSRPHTFCGLRAICFGIFPKLLAWHSHSLPAHCSSLVLSTLVPLSRFQNFCPCRFRSPTPAPTRSTKDLVGPHTAGATGFAKHSFCQFDNISFPFSDTHLQKYNDRSAQSHRPTISSGSFARS